MNFLAIIFAALLCGVSAYPRKDELQCQAPNGGGLTPVLKEFVEMLPLDKILQIYLTAVSSDAEVQKVMEYLESDDFLNIIAAVTGTPEFYKLIKVGCDELYLDIVYYLNVLNDILGLPTVPRPMHMNRAVKARSGFHGMLLDLLDVMDVQGLKKLFQEKAKTDKYVQQALEIIGGQDFKNIIEALHKTPSYNKMLDDLRKMEVKVDAIIEFIRKFFGW